MGINSVSCVMEIMENESRSGLRPDNLGVAELLSSGARSVRIEKSAGIRSGFSDTEYKEAGATLCTREQAWHSDLVIKVKQPLEEEFIYLHDGRIVFCFYHLADNLPLLDVLLENGVTAIAYETIWRQDSGTHILAEMSKIAGRIAYFDGANLLKEHKGMLIGPESKVLILGLGNAGKAAAKLVFATEPKMLYLLDKNPEVFDIIERHLFQGPFPFPRNLRFRKYDENNANDQDWLASTLESIDLLIAAPHVPGERQGKIVLESMIKGMKPGSVAIDVSIDQGGALETSSHFKKTGEQTFIKHGVVHYCVPNMPGCVPLDSTPALTRETFQYISELARKGFRRAVLRNPALAKGVNTYQGWITHEGLARSIGQMENYRPLSELL